MHNVELSCLKQKNMRLFMNSFYLFSCLDEQLSTGSVGWRGFDSLPNTGIIFINFWVKDVSFCRHWPPRIVESSRFPSWRKEKSDIRSGFVCLCHYDLRIDHTAGSRRKTAALLEEDIISCACESAAAAAGGVMFCVFLLFFGNSFQSSPFCVSLHWLSAGDGGQEAREHAAQP